jgi:phenylacetate-CoA ligase
MHTEVWVSSQKVDLASEADRPGGLVMANAMMIAYKACPRPFQTIGINLVETTSWALDRSRTTRRYLDQLKAVQSWSREQLEKYQGTKLRQVVRYAYENVPFYRRLYDQERIDVEGIRIVEDLRRLPTITREDVRTNYDALQSRRRVRSKVQFTSGTTISPLKIRVSNDAIKLNRASSLLRDHWAGYNGERAARFVGDQAITDCADTSLYRRSFVMNRYIYSSKCISVQTSRRILDSLRRNRVRVLQCYPSAGYILAKFLERYDEHLPLKAVLYSSEPLHAFERELIEERFQCQAYGFYGQIEHAVTAAECEKGNYHLAMLDGILEVVNNGEWAEAGERGSTVVTSLANLAMPLIRYQLNDLTGYTGEDCCCGRRTPTIHPVESKADDLIITPSGRIVTPLAVTSLLKSARNVLEGQIVQGTIDSLTLRIVPLEDFSEEDEELLREMFTSTLGEDITIRVEKVSTIHGSAAGKKRRVINQISGDLFDRAFSEAEER